MYHATDLFRARHGFIVTYQYQQYWVDGLRYLRLSVCVNSQMNRGKHYRMINVTATPLIRETVLA